MKSSKLVGLLFITFLILSSLMIVGSAFAQSISEPSVPDFTAKVVANTIEVTIKNQPLTPYENGSYPSLYYMFRFKDHNTEEGFWDYDPVYFVLPSTYGGYHEASDSEFTVISISLEGHHFPSGLIDIQAIALVGNQYLTNMQNGTVYGFDGEISGWSNTQTLTVGENLPYSIWVAISLVVIVAVLVVTLVYWQRLHKQNPRDRRTVKLSKVLVIFLIFSIFFVSFTQIEVNAQSNTIYIRADGTVEGTDKIQRDGNVYTFTCNIVNQSVVVEIDSIIIDGADHLLQGNETGAGIDLAHRSNVTIKNLQIRDFNAGVGLYDAYNNTISENLLVNNLAAVSLTDSDNNSITENTIMDNENGIYFFSCYDNSVHGNSFINNTKQVFDDVWNNPWLPQLLSVNFWDNGTTGNYWSSYNGTDNEGDGIGDILYVIDQNNQDNCPLMTEFIIPEFPSWTILVVGFFAITLLSIAYRIDFKKKGGKE